MLDSFLEELLGKQIRRISAVNKQSVIDEEYGLHGTRFDVEFVGDNSVYDIEIQTTGSSSDRGRRTLLRRVRHYHASIVTRHLKKGAPYESLPNSYVIFICTFDPFGHGLDVYTQVHCITQLGSVIDSGEYTFYLNSEFTVGQASNTVQEYLKYLRDPQYVNETMDTYISRLHRDVVMARSDPEVRRYYMSLVEKLQIERAEGVREGIAQNKQETYRRLIKKGFSDAEARELAGLPAHGGGVSALRLGDK